MTSFLPTHIERDLSRLEKKLWPILKKTISILIEFQVLLQIDYQSVGGGKRLRMYIYRRVDKTTITTVDSFLDQEIDKRHHLQSG